MAITHDERLRRILNRVSANDDGCWEYMGARDQRGYGRANNPGGSSLVHRIIYKAFTGRDPPELDHTCHNPPCCNPAHLEEVDHLTNVRRGEKYRPPKCVNGHPYTPENTGVRTATGHIYCRACNRDRVRAAKGRNRDTSSSQG